MELTKIKELIEQYDSIIIFRHIQPDGDALGSAYGLQELIKTNYPDKKVYTVGEKSSFFNNFFPEAQEVDDYIHDYSLGIVLDTPIFDRIDGEYYGRCKDIIKIDHHLYVEKFSEYEWVDTSRSSVCEMIGQLAILFDWKMNQTAANYLYFGLTTDANRFMYCYTPSMLQVASKIVEAGAECERIYNYIYEETEESTRFFGYCAYNFKKTPWGVAYNKLTPEVLESIDVDPHKGAGMVNALANIKNIDIWAHFSENEDGTIRGELRSKGLPINTVANIFGGGGHVRAAGCTLLNWDEVDSCIDQLNKLAYTNKPYYKEFDVALAAVKEASKLVMDIYRSSDFDTQMKEDNTPVTRADLACDKYLREFLSKAFPNYGFLTEESMDNKDRLNKEYIWIIDPIDGTKDFVAKDDQFAINVALCKDHKIVMAILAVPAKKKIYFAFENGGAFLEENGTLRRIFTSSRNYDLVGCRSKFHVSMEDSKYFRQYEELITEMYELGSAYKFGLIAEGKCDINVKFDACTKEWDIAPGVLLVKEAGGSFTKPNGEELVFNRENVVNEEGFIVMNKYNKGLLKK